METENSSQESNTGHHALSCFVYHESIYLQGIFVRSVRIRNPVKDFTDDSQRNERINWRCLWHYSKGSL